MNCPFCHADIHDTASFCPECGQKLTADTAETAEPEMPAEAPVTETEAPAAGAEPAEAPVNETKPAGEPKAPQTEPAWTHDEPKKLLSVGAYMALEVLFCLPVIGLIFLFIWGAGRPKNESLRRFAASVLIWRLLLYALLLVAAILLVIFAGTAVPKLMAGLQAFLGAIA